MESKTVENSQRRADELEERLIDFAVRVVRLSASLPPNAAGKHIAGQVLRCGTSPAPNYGEARGAESEADFIHKLRIVLKELITKHLSGSASLNVADSSSCTCLARSRRRIRSCAESSLPRSKLRVNARNDK